MFWKSCFRWNITTFDCANLLFFTRGSSGISLLIIVTLEMCGEAVGILPKEKVNLSPTAITTTVAVVIVPLVVMKSSRAVKWKCSHLDDGSPRKLDCVWMEHMSAWVQGLQMTSLHCWWLLLDLCSYSGGTVFIYHYKSSFYDIVDLFHLDG